MELLRTLDPKPLQERRRGGPPLSSPVTHPSGSRILSAMAAEWRGGQCRSEVSEGLRGRRETHGRGFRAPTRDALARWVAHQGMDSPAWTRSRLRGILTL